MRKFVNDPKKFVPEFLEGVALATAARSSTSPKYNLIMPGRHAQGQQGLDHPGLGLRP